jgi:hypothetical protein
MRDMAIDRIAFTLVLGFVVSGASACAEEAQDDESVNREVNTDSRSVALTVSRVLAANPGAVQISPNSVQLDEGVTLIVPTEHDAVVAPNSASGRCLGGNLCVFQDSNFNGSILQLSGCKDVNLANFNMDNGHPWNNQVSSIDNPLPRSGPAKFFNNGNLMLTLNGGSFLKNLASDTSADGTGNANDKIDTVRTCP